MRPCAIRNTSLDSAERMLLDLSLDSAEQMLLDLPLDEPKQFQSDLISYRKDVDLPSLKEYSYADKLEKHPLATSKQTLEGSFKSTLDVHDIKDQDSFSGFREDAVSVKTFSSDSQLEVNVDVYDSCLKCFLDENDSRAKRELNEVQSPCFSTRQLASNISPRSILEFPFFTSTLKDERKGRMKLSELAVVLENNLERVLEMKESLSASNV